MRSTCSTSRCSASQSLTAAVGFAATLLFFTISVAIGFTIACSALVSRCARPRQPRRCRAAGRRVDGVHGADDVSAHRPRSGRSCASSLALLGATRRDVGALDAFPPDRAAVDADRGARHVHDRHTARRRRRRRAMYVTLGGGIAAAILDPIFIFGLDLGLDGAAISTVLSRCRAARRSASTARTTCITSSRLPNRAAAAAAARPFFAIGAARRDDADRDAGRQRLCHRRDRGASATVPSPAGRSSAASSRWPSASSSPCRARSGRSSARISARGVFDRLQRDHARQPDRDDRLCAGRLGAAGAVCRADRRAVRRDRAGARTDHLLLPFRGRQLPVQRRDLRVERRLQQSRLSDLFDGVQLGPLDARRHSVRLGRRRTISAPKACSPAGASAPSCSASPRWSSAFARCAGIAQRQPPPRQPLPALPPAANSPFSTGKASTLQ